MLKNVELRKLPAGHLCSIAAILETNHDWKKVMSCIPRNPRSEYFEPKYTNEHIKQIEDHARTSNRKCAEILFEEWGTSGRIRPTLSTLKEVVHRAEIYRAADEIALMLKESPPPRPNEGPGAQIDTSLTALLKWEQQLYAKTTTNNRTTMQMKSLTESSKLSQSCNDIPDFSAFDSFPLKKTAKVKSESDLIKFSDSLPDFDMLLPDESQAQDITPEPHHTDIKIDTVILTDENLIHFEYKHLEAITRRFSERLLYTPQQNGPGTLAGKIGSGGFGDVYAGFHPKYGQLAVKKARPGSAFAIALKLFNSEVKFLSQFRHKNIVPILGYSRDGACLCIVCEYIGGGSLDRKLEAKVLSEKHRINIMVGTAEGLRYLHGYEKPEESNPESQNGSVSQNSRKNFVHGDVKSANILLTIDFTPKLCDFGIAKQSEMTYQTTAPVGTQAYMAPEGFSGTVTQKNDIYAFGIVLLELLTGLKPIVVNNSETINIKDFVEENCPNNEINHILDPFAKKWTKAKEIYELAKKCLVRQRQKRPTSEDIYKYLCNMIADMPAADAQQASQPPQV